MEYLSICRVCLSDNLDNDYSEISDICQHEISYCEILKLIAPQVDFDDDDEKQHLTKYICIECKTMCVEIITFRDQILYSNETLNHHTPDDEEEISYPMEVNKLEDCFSLQEIQNKNEPTSMLTCDEMIVEVDENVYEEEYEQNTEDVKEHLTESFSRRKSITITDDIIRSNPVTKTKDDTKHLCIICLQVFNEKNDHDDHMREHKQEINLDPIGCIYCKKFFDKFGALLRHLKSHEENKV